MSKKLHITKLEEEEVEVGVQLRDSNPQTGVENRIFVNRNTGELKAFLNGEDVHLSFDIYEIDPVNPAEKQVWLNSGTNSLKWKFGGVVKTIALDQALRAPSKGTLTGYLGTLTEAELGQIADVSTVLPNYLIDAFNGRVENSTLLDLRMADSSLMVKDGFNTGTYNLERRTSPAYNYAEGVAVIKSQALRPKSIVDNLDGTNTIVLNGDMTDILWVGAELLTYEQEFNGEEKLQDYFLLDGNLEPARLPVTSVTYDNVTQETSAVVTHMGLDITLGFAQPDFDSKLRFKPVNLKVEAGSDGSLGALTELTPESIEGLGGLSAVLGEELISKVSTQLAQENIVKHRIESSPNKQNWVLQVMCSNNDNGRVAGSVYMWYSTDGLKTLNFVDNWVGYTSSASVDTTLTFSNYQNHNTSKWFSNQQLKINDDGRYVFSYTYYDPSSTWTNILYFGDLSRPNFEPVLFNGNFGGYAGTISFEQSVSYSYYTGTLEVDWDYGIVFIFMARSTLDAYLQMYEIDWANNNTYPRSYCSLGTDYYQQSIQGVSFVKEFEDETQWFGIFEHANTSSYAHKMRHRRLFDELESGVYAGPRGTRGDRGNLGATVSPSDGDRYFGGAISYSLEGGVRHETSAYFHQKSHLRIVDYGFDKTDDTLIMLSECTDEGKLILHGINFGRTTYGKPNATDLSFDFVPDDGSFTLDVTDVQSSTTETTSPIPFSADAAQLKSILENITFIGAGNVEVTGSYAGNFEVRLSLFRRQEMHFTVNTNSLSQSTTAVNITVNELEAGFKPVWLRHDNHPLNTELYNPANGLAVQLDSNKLFAAQLHSGDRNHSDYGRENTLGQSMWVRGKKIIAHVLCQETSNGHDTTQASIIKIPDYTQLYGDGAGESRRVSPGTNVEALLMHKGEFTTEDDRGTRIAQKFNSESNPYSMYIDGKIHLRTLMLWLHPEERNATDGRLRRPTKRNAFVRVRVMPVGSGGLPDWDNPLAISQNVKWNDLPNKNDSKWVPFMLPNTKLEPNTDYFFGVESVGLDFESDVITDSENKFQLHLGSRDLTTTGTCFTYKPNLGGWVSANEQIWHKWYDYYFTLTHNAHESGINHAFRPFIHEWHDGSSAFETTIYPRGNSDSELYLATYRITGGHNPNSYASYSHVQGGSHTYVFEIDDTGGLEDAPIVKDPEILGWDGSDQWDRYLSFAIAFGRIDDLSLGRNVDATFSKFSTGENDYYYNISSHFGGHHIGYDVNMNRRKEYSGAGYGIEDDPDFLYGTCVHFNGGGGGYIYHHAIDMTPWQNDFIWECEYKPAQQDLDGSLNMLFSSNQLIYIAICGGRLYLYVTYNGTGRYVYSDELIEARYQRLRVTRDWENGIQMWRNYSSVGGTWELLSTTGYGNSETGAFFKHGVVIGDSDNNRVYYGIGRWTENANYNSYGRMGYMKMAIGTTEFAYEGLNFEQRPTYKLRNLGHSVNSLRVVSAGQTSISNRAVGDFGIFKHKLNSAKSRSNFTVLKYKGAIPSGRTMATKLTLYKASNNDPSAVEGYLLSYYKK